jgi:hypothetical protein
MQGGPSGGLLPAGDPDWTSDLGSYFIDPSAPIGASNSGDIKILYEAYSADPSKCSTCYLLSGEMDVPFSVSVVAASPEVPEPSTLLGAGIALLAVVRSRRRR